MPVPPDLMFARIEQDLKAQVDVICPLEGWPFFRTSGYRRAFGSVEFKLALLAPCADCKSALSVVQDALRNIRDSG